MLAKVSLPWIMIGHESLTLKKSLVEGVLSLLIAHNFVILLLIILFLCYGTVNWVICSGLKFYSKNCGVLSNTWKMDCVWVCIQNFLRFLSLTKKLQSYNFYIIMNFICNKLINNNYSITELYTNNKKIHL